MINNFHKQSLDRGIDLCVFMYLYFIYLFLSFIEIFFSNRQVCRRTHKDMNQHKEQVFYVNIHHQNAYPCAKATKPCLHCHVGNSYWVVEGIHFFL